MISKDLRSSLHLVWPLLLGVFMIMTGNGLQGTLLSLRADYEGFSGATIGCVMALYYVGFVIGGYTMPRLLASVGHIRLFAGTASLASATILLHGVFIYPPVWAVIRLLSGISFSGLIIATESWLNNMAINKLRAQILGVYIGCIHLGLFIGQFLIITAPISDIGLFVLVSVLISLSLIPVTLADKPAPAIIKPEKMPIRDILRIAPLAAAGVFTAGLCGSIYLVLGPVYAVRIGLGTAQTALFVAIYILGAALLPFLLGWLSDRLDRRKILTLIALAALLCACGLAWLKTSYLLTFVLGGLVTSLWSISVAYTNDRIRREQAVSAAASILAINGIGACIGPFLGGFGLDMLGPQAFFLMIACMPLAVAALGLFRMVSGEKIIVAEQSEFVNLPLRTSQEILRVTEEW